MALAFVFGFALSTLPLLNAGLGLAAALGVVVAADTLSIATMEIVDNAVMALIPGAMDAGLVNPVFWLGMALSLLIAYAVAFPVNRSLLARGKGHALTHVHHVAADSGARRWPVPGSAALAAAIGTFLLGGFVVSVADALEDPGTHRTAPGVGPPEAVAVPTVGGPQRGETPVRPAAATTSRRSVAGLPALVSGPIVRPDSGRVKECGRVKLPPRAQRSASRGKPCCTPHTTAWVRLTTSILR